MEKTIRVKFSKGVFFPLEKLELEEGAELPISFEQEYLLPLEERIKRMNSAAGGWKGLVDCDALIRQIYADRRKGLPGQ